jgi:hypothetical protein
MRGAAHLREQGRCQRLASFSLVADVYQPAQHLVSAATGGGRLLVIGPMKRMGHCDA